MKVLTKVADLQRPLAAVWILMWRKRLPSVLHKLTGFRSMLTKAGMATL